MKPSRRFPLSCLVVFMVLLGVAGCSHAKPKVEESAPSVEESELGSSDQGKAMGLQTIHFSFDSNLLDNEAKSLLKRNAEILKSRNAARVQIEGHCDNRGGIQYNIALGDQRANSVKRFLVDLGVSENQLSTISYGKERPLDLGDDEAAYAKNRRANFVVTAK
jgi:peptidoglycan-associated lipoprotein